MQQLPQPSERIGAYRLEAVLAAGGQGTVYRGRHEGLGTPVAVKILHAPDPTTLARFQREAQTLATLRHPSLVRVADLGRSPGGFNYLVMDYVEGQTLLDRIRLGGVLSPAEAVETLTPVAEALSHCHSLGILHRDVKPENILLSPSGPLLVDFGLVRRDPSGGAPSGEAEAQRLTQTGEILGTPSYMAPEQADGSKAKIDSTCDVYGLAATLYFVLTGEPPFSGGSLFTTLNKVLHDPPPDPRDRVGVPAPLAELCLQALAKEPSERPSSEEFVRRLEAGATEQQRGALLPAALAILVALGALAAFVLVRGRSSDLGASLSPGTTPSPGAEPSTIPTARELPSTPRASALPPLPTRWAEITRSGFRWSPRRQPSALAWSDRLWVFPEAGDATRLQPGIHSSRDLGGSWQQVQTTYAPAPQRTGSVIHQGALFRLGGFSSRAQYPVRQLTLRGSALSVTGEFRGPGSYTSDMNAVSFRDSLWVLGATSIRRGIEPWESYANVAYRLERSGGDRFQEIRRPEWGPRYGAKVVVYRERVWVLGGRLHPPGKKASFSSEVWWSEDPRQGWTQVEVRAPFPPTSHHATCVWRGRMWVASGYNQGKGPITLYHSWDGASWEALNLPGAPGMVSSASLVPLDEDAMFLLGGQLPGAGGDAMRTSDQVWMVQ